MSVAKTPEKAWGVLGSLSVIRNLTRTLYEVAIGEYCHIRRLALRRLLAGWYTHVMCPRLLRTADEAPSAQPRR